MASHSEADLPIIRYFTPLVKIGAGWLDQNRPDWWEEIDLAELDMSHGRKCVLGQLWRHYHIFLEHVLSTEDDRWGRDRGFNFSPELSYCRTLGAEETYRVLTTLWREEIKQRREKV
jgi:hypothetical protein